MNELNSSEKRILTSMFLVTLIAFLCFLITLLSGYGVLLPIEEKVDDWFQRSGSLIVVLALLIDLYAYKNTTGFAELNDIEAEKRFSKGLSFMRALMVLVPLSGTLIWGYGDLIHQYLF